MAITIPDSHKGPLKKLALMPPKRRKSLIRALQKAPKLLHVHGLTSRVSEQSGLDENDVSAWIRMLASMYLAFAVLDESFANRVAEAAEGLVRDESPKRRLDRKRFAADLIELLSCHSSLGVTAKALDVRSEYGSVFHSARIITDIRPVFGPDVEGSPLAAAVVHTLRITYRERDSDKDFYVALDARDLHDLRSLVDRATEKEVSLRSQLEKTDMDYLEVEVE